MYLQVFVQGTWSFLIEVLAEVGAIQVVLEHGYNVFKREVGPNFPVIDVNVRVYGHIVAPS
jgi:hypothetical protein